MSVPASVPLGIPLTLLALVVATASAQDVAPPRPADAIEIRQAFVLSRVVGQARTPIHADPIEAEVVSGRWAMPTAGEKAALPDGSTREWKTIEVGENGGFGGPDLRGAYVAARVPSESDRVWILEAGGHSMVYVDGVPRAGNPYGYDWHRLPVAIRSGGSTLLFVAGRGQLRARLVPPRGEAQIETEDPTFPDVLVGEPISTWGALTILNTTEGPLDGLTIETTCGDGEAVLTTVPNLVALGVRKVGFRIESEPPLESGEVPLKVVLKRQRPGEPAVVLDETSLALAARRPDQPHRRTFVSGIDGSIQYYAVQPMSPRSNSATADRPALFLSLHGASVEAIGQANAYAPKDWGYLIAPTNRRPYGFDWEDWGRLDALEVLEHAQGNLGTDPRRTYLTGHSMGGHGTWHLGVTFPDLWAAIAPSAGWVSMWSYAGASRIEDQSPMGAILERARRPSDTLALASNLARNGVYVLHGDRDDNVPVDQARIMRAELGRFHPDFAYHEQPGAGHWWGNACVDWPPLFAFLRERRQPERTDVRQVDFTTASPGVSARCDWLTIRQQIRPFVPSRAEIDHDPANRTFRGTTENIALLTIDLGHLDAGRSVSIALDGQSVEVSWPSNGTAVWLARSTEGDAIVWRTCEPPPASAKSPARMGPFKEAFRNRVQLVYGTRGTTAENAWALARARFDAETFGYRGNGSMDVIPDTAFDSDTEPDRNVVLYGNVETNAAWAALLGDGPVEVRRGGIRLGDRSVSGDGLGALIIRPRPGGDVASVGAVTGTGIEGFRRTDRLPVFTSGVAYPDVLIVGPEMHRTGIDGVAAAGFFGNDWGVESGELVWANPPSSE